MYILIIAIILLYLGIHYLYLHVVLYYLFIVSDVCMRVQYKLYFITDILIIRIIACLYWIDVLVV